MAVGLHGLVYRVNDFVSGEGAESSPNGLGEPRNPDRSVIDPCVKKGVVLDISKRPAGCREQMAQFPRSTEGRACYEWPAVFVVLFFFCF